MEKNASLWSAAAYQESLLQSYRQLHLLLQSVLLIIGTGLTASIICIPSSGKILLLYILLTVITSFAGWLLYRMQLLIKARREDVDFFHQQIIEAEQSLPETEQVMTRFKVYQKFHRNPLTFSAFFTNFERTTEIRNQLTEKGKGHTRQVLDQQLFRACGLVWFCFHGASLYYICV